MPQYRRDRVPGGTYFLTIVTERRRPLFADPAIADGLEQLAGLRRDAGRSADAERLEARARVIRDNHGKPVAQPAAVNRG